MIRITDSIKLASTKLRTRKIRLVVTLVVSSLLFSLLFAGSFIVRGIVNSTQDFSQSGFGDRYITSASPATIAGDYQLLSDKDFVAEVEKLQKKINADKKAEATRLGLEFDTSKETILINPGPGQGGPEKIADSNQPEVQKLLNDRKATKTSSQLEEFGKISASYQAISTFSSTPKQLEAGSSVAVLLNGKEDFENQNSKDSNGPPDFNGVQSINNSWTSISSQLLEPFMLEGQSLDTGSDQSVPVIAPYSATEEILGLKKLPDNATSQQKLERLKEVRQKAGGYTFELCVRNSTSNERLNLVASQKNEMLQNKDKKDYKAPTLQYDYPKTACGDIVITKDTRTAEEKKITAAWEAFDKKFGKPDPASSIIKLRIVGISSDENYDFSFSASSVIGNLLRSSLGAGWFSPDKPISANPVTANMFPTYSSGSDFSQRKTFYAEFSSANQLKRFVEEKNCNPDFSKAVDFNSFDAAENCQQIGKSGFFIGSFGSNSAAIDEFERIFSKVFLIAAIIVGVIASFVMMGNIGRIIADGRRETAVFRAIGAKRIDISQIYLTYTIMISGLVAITSFVLGSLIAGAFHSKYQKETTLNALLAYNQNDLSKSFALFKIDINDIAIICLIIILAGVIAASMALAGNVRRNPIKDMRDER